MSTHSSELGPGHRGSDQLSPAELLALAAEERDDDRMASSGGHFYVDSTESESPRASDRVTGDTGSERVDLDWHLTEDERAAAPEGLAKARQALALASGRLGVREVTARDLLAQQAKRIDHAGAAELRHQEWKTARETARKLSIESGLEHRITTDIHGNLIVEPVLPRN